MAFWSRIKGFKRFCDVNHGHFRQYRSPIQVSNRFSFTVHSGRFEASNVVRFFAAPSEGNQKKEERDSREPTLNEQITVPSVRLVTSEGHFLVSRYEALSRAKSLMLDLVMVDAQAKPPVCKIFDYKKDKYLQQMKEKERTKSKSTLKKGSPKEVRFACKITQRDLQVKADMVKRLMESGHRVKCTSIEPTASLDMETMLSRFSSLIADVAVVESGPRVEKKQAFLVVRHIKFGPLKKGPSKNTSKTTTQDKDSDESTDEDTQENEDNESLEKMTMASSSPLQSPLKPETENRYAKVPRKPETGNGAPKPEIANRYAKVAANVAPTQSNRYSRPSPNPRIMTNDASQTYNQRHHQADGSNSAPDPSSALVTNRYKNNSPARDPRLGNFPRRSSEDNSGQGRWGGENNSITDFQRR